MQTDPGKPLCLPGFFCFGEVLSFLARVCPVLQRRRYEARRYRSTGVVTRTVLFTAGDWGERACKRRVPRCSCLQNWVGRQASRRARSPRQRLRGFRAESMLSLNAGRPGCNGEGVVGAALAATGFPMKAIAAKAASAKAHWRRSPLHHDPHHMNAHGNAAEVS